MVSVSCVVRNIISNDKRSKKWHDVLFLFLFIITSYHYGLPCLDLWQISSLLALPIALMYALCFEYQRNRKLTPTHIHTHPKWNWENRDEPTPTNFIRVSYFYCARRLTIPCNAVRCTLRTNFTLFRVVVFFMIPHPRGHRRALYYRKSSEFSWRFYHSRITLLTCTLGRKKKKKIRKECKEHGGVGA